VTHSRRGHAALSEGLQALEPLHLATVQGGAFSRSWSMGSCSAPRSWLVRNRGPRLVVSRAAFTSRTLATPGAAVAATGVVDIAEEYHSDVREELHHGSRVCRNALPCTLLYDYQFESIREVTMATDVERIDVSTARTDTAQGVPYWCAATRTTQSAARAVWTDRSIARFASMAPTPAKNKEIIFYCA